MSYYPCFRNQTYSIKFLLSICKIKENTRKNSNVKSMLNQEKNNVKYVNNP